MKKFCIIFICLIFFHNVTSATTYSSDPEQFVSELVQDAVNKLSDNKVSDEDKTSYIEKIALENVDIKALGLYTLGEIRKSANEEDVKNFQIIFEKYFLKSITSRLKDYSTNEFKVIGADVKSSNYTIIKSKIAASENKPEIKIDWRIYTKNPSKPLIRDLIVEGLSLARTQREEFSSILSSNNNDIKSLILKLEEFINNS